MRGFWRRDPIIKDHVSDLDRFLQAYDKKPEASSASRRAEENKHKAIETVRNNAEAQKETLSAIWEDL